VHGGVVVSTLDFRSNFSFRQETLLHIGSITSVVQFCLKCKWINKMLENFRRRTYILGQESVQRCKIPQRIYLWCANIFQTYWEFSIHKFLLVSPTRHHKSFTKGEALRLLRTNSLPLTFEGNIKNFEKRFLNRGCPTCVVEKHLSEVKFSDRKASLKQKNRDARTRILPFVTQYHAGLPNLKTLLTRKWHLVQNQPQLISYRKGKSLKDILVRAKL